MFAKLSALLLALPYVAALTVNTPTGWTTAGPATLSWTGTTTDPPTFSVFLVNTVFHDTFAIANNVPTSNGQLQFTIPQVPERDGYEIRFTDPSNVNTVYAQSGTFSIGAATTSSATASSTSSTSATSTSTGSLSSLSATPSQSSVSSASGSATGTSTSGTPSPSNLSGGTSVKVGGIVPAAALALSAAIGAVLVF